MANVQSVLLFTKASIAAKAFAKIDANAKQILADMFVDMSIDAGEKLSTIKEAGLLNKNTAIEGGRQYKPGYDYTKSFEQQIDDFKAGLIPDRDTLIIGATPKIYQDIGFNPLPMTINKTHVEYALYGTKNTEHHIGETMLKQLPKVLEKPIAVIASQSAPTTSVVVLVSLQHNGEQVIAPVYLDGAGRKNGVSIDSNAVTSVHGRGNAIKGLLKNALNEEAKQNIGVFYWDKKAATALLTTAGVTMPQGLSLSDGYVHSIREKNSPVKPKFNDVTETQQFKRWFGNWQKHPENASKIVNADGTPKVMYHGTGADFTSFDKRRAKEGAFGKGFYFAPSKGMAQAYGSGTIMETYLSIKTPYILHDSIGFTGEDYRNMQNQFGLQDRITDKNVGKVLQKRGYDGIVVYDGNGNMKEVIAFEPTQIKSATDNIGTFDKTNPDIRYKVPVDAKSPTYEELVAKDPIAVVDVGHNVDGLSYAELKKQVLQNADARKLFDVPHLNSDTEISIFLTPSSFTHAFSNLTADFGVDTILAMDHIDEIIHEAILTHIDDPRNPAKAENRVFTFFATIEGENGIEPIKLKVKEYAEDNFERLPRNIRSYFEKNGIITPHNRLYDAVALEVVAVESAKKESGASASGTESETQSVAKGTPNSTIKIADLLGLVNGDAKKYIPNRNDKSLKLPVGDTSQQRQAAKETLTRYQEALRGQREDTKIMEQEFARLAKAFETQARRSGKKDVAIV